MLLLFSTGQVLAVAHVHTMNFQDQSQTMAHDCDHMNKQENSQQSMNNNAMDHTNMTTMSDCCETICQCPQAMCSTVLLLPVNAQSTQFYLFKPMIHWSFADGFYLNKDHSPLYRPPII
ncbi:MAG: hypothetical protein DWP95_05365 [Proteobacteria bacterium]|nr:MAG: hypothetical protein DWP95_05365 [Pseudomonadota bacterium]